MSDEKRTLRTEVPFLQDLARATLDINESLRLTLKAVEESADAKSVERAMERNSEFVQQLNELLAEHGKEPITESQGILFPSLILVARRLVSGTSQALVFLYLSAWLQALQEYYNAVQVLRLSKTLENLLDEQVWRTDRYCIEFKERYLELKD